VDLKLKHNTFVDSAKSLKLNEEIKSLAKKADDQGRTIMTFTIVTIIFVGTLYSDAPQISH
jgi:hypothetical protein